MKVSNLKGKVALVTGGASGIGRETALALARRGADLVICDINEEGLAKVCGEIEELGREASPHRVDVASRSEMEAFADAVHADHDAVDILVNNAGVALVADFQSASLDDWDWILGINLKGVIHGVHFFTPKMIQRGQGGHVVNVSSVLGFLGSSRGVAYVTTKFAVFGLSESLRQELAPHGIGVTTICPGLINTPIVQNSRRRGTADTGSGLARMTAVYERRNYGPEKVATAILKGINRNSAVVPVSPEAHLMYRIKRFAPWLAPWLGRQVEKRMFDD
jgi:NAD(P)-dependent dehydrogenase (short-subunit alcohol dehydrogenase family)